MEIALKRTSPLLPVSRTRQVPSIFELKEIYDGVVPQSSSHLSFEKFCVDRSNDSSSTDSEPLALALILSTRDFHLASCKPQREGAEEAIYPNQSSAS